MTKNPLYNATAAAAYIIGIVLLINTFALVHTPDNTILIPITMLGLFVLSAAVMGFLFVFGPFELYMENQKKEAVTYFLKTIGYFACFAVLFAGALLYSAL